MHTQNHSFMRVVGTLTLSSYRLRSNRLKVADEFLEHVKSLPLQYEKGIYFSFLEDYGTHYTRNGNSGGEYELIYVLNQDTINERSMCISTSVSICNNYFDFPCSFCHNADGMIFADLTEKTVQDCLKLGIGGDVSKSSLTLGGNVEVNPCGKKVTKDEGLLSLP